MPPKNNMSKSIFDNEITWTVIAFAAGIIIAIFLQYRKPDFKVNDLNYCITSETEVGVSYSLVNFLGINPIAKSKKNISIPDTVTYQGKTYTITSVCSGAFKNYRHVVSISIPNSVSSIGSKAFENCKSLTSINIPDGVSTIDEHTFNSCQSLRSIALPNSITAIKKSAFMDCESLISLIIPDGTECIQANAFKGCVSLHHVTIPYTVEEIDYSAFENCQSLLSITIPYQVESIRNGTFKGCTSLCSVELPIGITCIESRAFKDCQSLRSIEIPHTIKHVEKKAFERSGIYNNHAYWDNGVLYVSNCLIEAKDVSNHSIRKSTKLIADEAFNGCKSLSTIIFPDSVLYIGKKAFKNCKLLENIVFPNVVYSIGKNAFNNTAYYKNNANWQDGILYFGNCIIEAKDKKSHCINKDIHVIAHGAFSSCTSTEHIEWLAKNCWCYHDLSSDSPFNWNLNSITFGDSVEYIYPRLCQGLEKITHINIPNSVKGIGYRAFEDCISLTTITLPNSESYIGSHALSNCKSLTAITIPEKVNDIHQGIFVGCDALNSIHVNSKNSRYDSRNDCNAIIETATNKLIAGCKKTNIPADVIVIAQEAFALNNSIHSISIPHSVQVIGYGAFYSCQSLTSITLPKGISVIDDYAFWGCTSLTELFYDGTIDEWKRVSKSEKWIGETIATTIQCKDGICELCPHMSNIKAREQTQQITITQDVGKETIKFVPKTVTIDSEIKRTDCHLWKTISIELTSTKTILYGRVTPTIKETYVYCDRTQFIEDAHTGKRYYLMYSDLGTLQKPKILYNDTPLDYTSTYPDLPMSVKCINIYDGSTYVVKNLKIR